MQANIRTRQAKKSQYPHTVELTNILAFRAELCYTNCMNTIIKQVAADASAAQLAYLGDAVLEVWIRRRLVVHNVPHPSEAALAYVTAPMQSDAVERILPLLTDSEADVYRRARNNVHAKVPRHATQAQYRRATGLEALCGYLELAGNTARLNTLLELAYPALAQGSENSACTEM